MTLKRKLFGNEKSLKILIFQSLLQLIVFYLYCEKFTTAGLIYKSRRAFASYSLEDLKGRALLRESFLRDRNSLSFKLTGKVAAKTMHLGYLRFTEQRLKTLPMTIQKTTKFPQMATTSITVKMAVQKKSAP